MLYINYHNITDKSFRSYNVNAIAIARSLNFLTGWPKEKLINNPKKCIFSYFKYVYFLLQEPIKHNNNLH